MTHKYKLTEKDIKNITINPGSHSSPEEGHCLLEVVAMLSGEEFSDKPHCVDPVLREFGISWNDGMRSDEEREQLKQYIPRLVGTNKGRELSEIRSWMALDWIIRVYCPTWLSLTPSLQGSANLLSSLPEISSPDTLIMATKHIKVAWEAAWEFSRAAMNASWDAARAAGWEATRVTAWEAARAAGWDAARAAGWEATRVTAWEAARGAREAACEAAWEAARGAREAACEAAWEVSWATARGAMDASWDASGAAREGMEAARDAAVASLEPTVLVLQKSAHDLFSRMIDAGSGL